MTLRVQDLKPGDVVRMDVRVTEPMDSDGQACAHFGTVRLWLGDASLALGNAELVVRPRPVRKGDQVAHLGKYRAIFVAVHDTYIFTMAQGRPNEQRRFIPGHWSHADGSPIDWEASE